MEGYHGGFHLLYCTLGVRNSSRGRGGKCRHAVVVVASMFGSFCYPEGFAYFYIETHLPHIGLSCNLKRYC